LGYRSSQEDLLRKAEAFGTELLHRASRIGSSISQFWLIMGLA